MIESILRLLLYSLVLAFVMTSCSSSKKYSQSSSRYSKKRIKNANTDDVYASADDYVVVVRTSKSKNSQENKKGKNQNQNPDEEELRDAIYETASQYLGLAYRTGGRSPSTGFDCSGFTAYVMQQNGIKIGGSSRDMAKLGIPKDKSDLQVGDLLFFGKNGNIHHVGLVARNINGEIEMIHSASSTGISIDIIANSRYWSDRFMYGRDIITPYLTKQ